MRALLGLAAVSLAGCAATVAVTRTRPPPIRPGDARLAVAASGSWAPELVAHVRAALTRAVQVEACVLGCPPVGLYASVSLSPGPHEGRTRRTCQAEVYTGASWVAPRKVRGTFVSTVERPEECFAQLTAWLSAPRPETVRVRLDESGPLRDVNGLVRSGRLDEARTRLEALAEAAGTAGAHFNLGAVLEAQGLRDAARRSYQLALALNPPVWMREAIEDFAESAP